MIFRWSVDPTAEESVTAVVHEKTELIDRLEELVGSVTGKNKLYAYTEDEMVLLPLSEIVCITILGGKTYAVDQRGKQYRLRQRLYELEAMVPSCFIRINKSALANETMIERFTTSFSGAVDVVFRGGYREYVSRRCFAQIKRRFNEG